MATLHNFSRSLEPIRDFDDDELSCDVKTDTVGSKVVPYCSSNGSSSGVILTAFIDHLCTIYEKNPDRREKLFHIICKELRKARFLKLVRLSDSLRQQMRDGFAQLLQAAVQSIGQDVAVTSTSSIKQQSLVSFFSPTRQPLVSQPSIGLVIECLHQTSKLLSEFENIKPIEGGKGAYGKVFKAKKKSDGVQYAVKKIKVKNRCDDALLLSIRREVEILARLSHPNVVRYYDSWEGFEFVPPDSDSDDDSDSSSPPVQRKFTRQDSGPITPTHFLYIQMELCTGTLKEWLSERIRRGLNYDDSYQISKQILKGVEFIHAKNYIHRDLKPLNIFLIKNSTCEVPNVKIGDFGLARNMVLHDINDAGTREVHFTADVGTPHYGAPEQLKGSDYSEKSDMFSVGLILYELYYSFETDMEKMQVFTKLRENGEIDDEFVKYRPVEACWIRQLTAKNPSSRPPAAEILREMRKHKSSVEASSNVLKGHIVNQRSELLDMKKQLREKEDLLQIKDHLLVERESLLKQKEQQIINLFASNSAAQKKILELEALLQQAKPDVQ